MPVQLYENIDEYYQRTCMWNKDEQRGLITESVVTGKMEPGQ